MLLPGVLLRLLLPVRRTRRLSARKTARSASWSSPTTTSSSASESARSSVWAKMREMAVEARCIASLVSSGCDHTARAAATRARALVTAHRATTSTSAAAAVVSRWCNAFSPSTIGSKSAVFCARAETRGAESHSVLHAFPSRRMRSLSAPRGVTRGGHSSVRRPSSPPTGASSPSIQSFGECHRTKSSNAADGFAALNADISETSESLCAR